MKSRFVTAQENCNGKINIFHQPLMFNTRNQPQISQNVKYDFIWIQWVINDSGNFQSISQYYKSLLVQSLNILKQDGFIILKEWMRLMPSINKDYTKS